MKHTVVITKLVIEKQDRFREEGNELDPPTPNLKQVKFAEREVLTVTVHKLFTIFLTYVVYNGINRKGTYAKIIRNLNIL